MPREIHGIKKIVYFSSVTENTHRFVERLDVDAYRIPLRIDRNNVPVINDDYILICPTYGGGVSISPMLSSDNPEPSRPVPPQVRIFLSQEENRKHLMGVIAAGNINFGEDYCVAGDVISRKFGVPYLHRFELMGSSEDIDKVHEIMRGIRLTVN